MSDILIRYSRPPDRTTLFRQQLVQRTDDCIVTLLEHATLTRPVIARDRVVLESGAPVVWFTFPDRWHDIGRFHTRDGSFTGWYANILTPVHFVAPDIWETTDLFLDVWLDDEGAVLLDESELQAAVDGGSVSAEHAARARAEAADLLAQARSGAWPPPICEAWTLARARAAVRDADGTRGGAAV
ncbi:MAG TPA: DUF402 domain-containing protein [Longimicrobiales bacterium]